MMHQLRLAGIAILLLLSAMCAAQAQEQSKPASVTPAARLAAAKNVFLKNGGGSDIPYDVISTAISEWGRFTVVDDPAQADIIVSVTSPDDGKKKEDHGGGFGLSAQGKPVSGHRAETPPPVSMRNDVLLAVYDAKTKVTLWSATEPPKSVQKGMSKEEKFAAAAERLLVKFRDKIEPQPAQ